MFEKFRTADELFSYKLGCALKMEGTVVDMLERLQGAAQSDELREQLRHHQEQHTLEEVRRATRASAQQASAWAS
jgi:ferritin-like metal-binding protein YciE